MLEMPNIDHFQSSFLFTFREILLPSSFLRCLSPNPALAVDFYQIIKTEIILCVLNLLIGIVELSSLVTGALQEGHAAVMETSAASLCSVLSRLALILSFQM